MVERFGECLRRHRQARALSQGTLAAQVGMHKSTISKLENSAQEPKWTQVLTLTTFFHFTLSQFMGEGEVGRVRYLHWLQVERPKLAERLRGTADTLEALTA